MHLEPNPYEKEVKRLLEILSRISADEEEMLTSFTERVLALTKLKEKVTLLYVLTGAYLKTHKHHDSKKIQELLPQIEEHFIEDFKLVLQSVNHLERSKSDRLKQEKVIKLTKPLQLKDIREIHEQYSQVSGGTKQVLGWALKKIKRIMKTEEIFIDSEDHLKKIIEKIPDFRDELKKFVYDAIHVIEAIKTFFKKGPTEELNLTELTIQLRRLIEKIDELQKVEEVEIIDPINKFAAIKKNAKQRADELFAQEKLITREDIQKDLTRLINPQEKARYLFFLAKNKEKLTEKAQRNLDSKQLQLGDEIAKHVTQAKQAYVDTLTKAHNKRAFMEKIKEEARKCSGAHNYFLSIISFDIDHFKLFNDNYGHETGDLVLGEVSEKVKQQIRTGDLFFRVGGEEFIVLLPRTHKKDAVMVAERINKKIKEKEYEFQNIKTKNNDRVRIKVSLGVSSYPEDTTNPEHNHKELISIADKRLYIAKTTGRDKVVSEGFELITEKLKTNKKSHWFALIGFIILAIIVLYLISKKMGWI
ncbi:GGDEF domain-containing protein [Candidatus Woesearchaeota archaeon]|jgi:diguanylate cyclase|nr:GGDEF domain-containing protein [Candidatus Woesearchaeota archaeon]